MFIPCSRRDTMNSRFRSVIASLIFILVSVTGVAAADTPAIRDVRILVGGIAKSVVPDARAPAGAMPLGPKGVGVKESKELTYVFTYTGAIPMDNVVIEYRAVANNLEVKRHYESKKGDLKVTSSGAAGSVEVAATRTFIATPFPTTVSAELWVVDSRGRESNHWKGAVPVTDSMDAMAAGPTVLPAIDPKTFEGRWEGYRLYHGGRDPYALEVFYCDPQEQRLYARRWCTNCEPPDPLYFTLKAKEGGKGTLFSTEYSDYNTEFDFRADEAHGVFLLAGGTYSARYDFTLKKSAWQAPMPDPAVLIGEWRYQWKKDWWDVRLDEANLERGTCKGTYIIGQGQNKGVHPLDQCKLARQRDALQLQFRTLDGRVFYSLSLAPPQGDSPATLWGRLQTLDGNFQVIYRKK